MIKFPSEVWTLILPFVYLKWFFGCDESRVMASAWQMFVVLCTVIMRWVCHKRPSAILLLLQGINICVRCCLSLTDVSYISPHSLYSIESYIAILCRVLLIVVFRSVEVLRQAVFMVFFLYHNCKNLNSYSLFFSFFWYCFGSLVEQNSSCANSVMLTLAPEIGNLSLVAAR